MLTQTTNLQDSLVPFPLACWQDFVFGDEEEQRLQILRELHVLWNFSDAQGADDRLEKSESWGCFFGKILTLW